MRVIYRPMGGLGNQLFQFACAKALADKNRAELFVDLDGLERTRLRKRPGTRHSFTLREVLGEAAGQEYSARSPLRESKMGESKLLDSAIQASNFMNLLSPRLESEKAFRFRELPTPESRGIYLCGNFQSSKYFSEVNTVSEIIWGGFEGLITNTQRGFTYPTMGRAVHVRRGDFIGSQKLHNLSPNYFAEALKSSHEDGTTVVFSDDTDWVRENVSLPKDSLFAEDLDGLSDNQELALMAQQKTIITSNSTFSWWGAWLAHWHHQATILTPQQWYRDGRDESSLVPKEWTKIESL